MNFDHFFAASRDKIVTAGLVGAGQFGASLINQAQHMPLLDVPFLRDLDLVLAKQAFLDAGVAKEDIAKRKCVRGQACRRTGQKNYYRRLSPDMLIASRYYC